MTTSSLRDRVGRLGPVRDVPRAPAGSAVVLALRRKEHVAIKVVDAAKLLAWGGLSLAVAKRVVDKVVESGEHVVEVPTVPDAHDFIAKLRSAGLSVTPRPRHSAKEIKELLIEIRKRMGLSQEQFALRFGLEVDAMQNWEQGRRDPGEWLYAYLRVIECSPDTVSRALEDE